MYSIYDDLVIIDLNYSPKFYLVKFLKFARIRNKGGNFEYLSNDLHPITKTQRLG